MIDAIRQAITGSQPASPVVRLTGETHSTMKPGDMDIEVIEGYISMLNLTPTGEFADDLKLLQYEFCKRMSSPTAPITEKPAPAIVGNPAYKDDSAAEKSPYKRVMMESPAAAFRCGIGHPSLESAVNDSYGSGWKYFEIWDVKAKKLIANGEPLSFLPNPIYH